jgi:hypothetical protein
MIELKNDEMEILKQEIGVLSAGAISSKESTYLFNNLLSSINGKKIDKIQLQPFGQILELLLSTGVIRKNFSPVEEQKIFRLYLKTPQGKERKKNIDELNKSLKALQTQKIEGISFSIKSPGVYSISISTDKCELSMNVNKSGVYADKLELGI